MTEPKAPHFAGFSQPTGAWLPPEVADLIRTIDNLAELKVVLVALLEAGQIGKTGDALSLTEMQERTDLTRQSCISGRRKATEHGLFLKRGPFYYVHWNELKPVPKPADQPEIAGPLAAELAELGVAPPIIAQMLRRYDEPYLRRHLDQTRRAMDAGIVRNPAGWLTMSLREDRPEALFTAPQQHQPWYTTEEYEKFINH